MSHELRSPLVTIRGYADLIRGGDSGPINDRQRRQLQVVVTNVERLEALIDDLLLAAKGSQGAGALTIASGDLHGLLEAAIANVEPKRRHRCVRIERAFPSTPLLVEADLRQLSQVLANLLGNALKFTDPGGWVRVGTAQPAADRVLIEVADSGIGIGEEHLSRIFDRFYQVDSSSTRSYTGLGLGLAISRAVVERHGGVLSVQSVQGEGSTFRVELPRTHPGSRAPTDATK